MAGKQISGDNLTSKSNLAGMSKNQLYEIMSQMKSLTEQNQQQARQVLVENPALTKALFQAQIMLGMVKPPQVVPTVQQTLPPKQSAQPPQQLNTPDDHSLPDQAIQPQARDLVKKQMQSHTSLPIPSTSVQTMPTHSPQPLQQTMGHPSGQGQMTSISHPQSSNLHSLTPRPPHPAPRPPSLQSQQVPIVPIQQQQSLYSPGIQHLPIQPPLPSQPRPPSMQAFQHQVHSQLGSHNSYQPSGANQPHLSQNLFNSVQQSSGSIGSSFQQGQPALPSQPPPHPLYQVGGGLQSRPDFSGQAGNAMQVDRQPRFGPGFQENATGGVQLPGPPLPGNQTGLGGQLPRGPQLTPEMEQAVVQQVMSLTQEQINLLPPEQRNQVLQLQQMLR